MSGAPFPTHSDAVSRRERAVILTVMLALFMAALEQTIVGPAMESIVSSVGGGVLLPWVATGYLLAATAASPILGAIADQKGRRVALLVCVGLFLVGSVLSALSTNLPMLVGARIVQGAGAGGLTSLPFVVIADRVPMHRRALYSAYISTIYALASVFGPIAGGLLSEFVHWTAIFWINVPLAIVVMVSIFALFDAEAEVRRTHPIDFPGALLLIAATVASVLWLTAMTGEADVNRGTLTVAMAILWLGFGWRMMRASHPLVPVSILTERTVLLCAFGLLFCQASNIGLAVYLPLYYQSTLALTAGESGFAILGLLVGIMLGAYIPPQLLRFDPRYKRLVVGSIALAFVGALALAIVLSRSPTIWAIEMATVVLGLGIGSAYPIFTLATQNAVDGSRMGAAIGVLGFMRAMGGTIGVAVVGSAALASGLARSPTAQAAVDLPAWTIALPACGFLAFCLLFVSLLPSRALTGYAKP